MTTQPITFYRDHRAEAGETLDFDLGGEFQPYKVSIYFRQPMAGPYSPPSDLPLQGAQMEFEALLSQVGGGVLAMTYNIKKGSKALISQVTAANQQEAFATFGMLQPGHRLRFEPWTHNFFDVSIGTHLFVPVDRQAEEDLKAFAEHLESLPADVETVVLTALRKPSLDARVQRLEGEVLKGPTSDRKPGWRGKAARLKPHLGTLLIGLNTMLLVVILLLQVKCSIPWRNGKKDSVPPAPPSPTQSQSQPPSLQDAEVNRNILNLLAAVSEGKKSGTSLAALWKGHFAKHPAKNEEAIAKILGDKGSKELVLLGLMKLEALYLRIEAEVEFFSRSDNSSKLAEKLGALDLDEDAKDLLATLSCRAYGKPVLPGAGGQAVDFAPGQTCDHFPTQRANKELGRLTIFFGPAGH